MAQVGQAKAWKCQMLVAKQTEFKFKAGIVGTLLFG